MVNANRCRLWLPLVWPLLALCADGALADQVCKYDSIPATAPASRFTDNGDGTVTDKAPGSSGSAVARGRTGRAEPLPGPPSATIGSRPLPISEPMSSFSRGNLKSDAVALVVRSPKPVGWTPAGRSAAMQAPKWRNR